MRMIKSFFLLKVLDLEVNEFRVRADKKTVGPLFMIGFGV